MEVRGGQGLAAPLCQAMLSETQQVNSGWSEQGRHNHFSLTNSLWCSEGLQGSARGRHSGLGRSELAREEKSRDDWMDGGW